MKEVMVLWKYLLNNKQERRKYEKERKNIRQWNR